MLNVIRLVMVVVLFTQLMITCDKDVKSENDCTPKNIKIKTEVMK